MTKETEINMDMSPEELQAAFDTLESGGDVPNANAQAPAPEPAAIDSEDKAIEQQLQQEKPPEQVPDGVATKDGKHIIPYTVLKSERERASRAEQIARDLQTQIDAFKNQAQDGKTAKTDGAATINPDAIDASDLTEDELELMKDEFPTMHKFITKAMSSIQKMSDKLKPVEQIAQQTQEQQADQLRQTVQDAIDSVPKLAHIQATDPSAFEMAKQFDGQLRQNPLWAEKPLAERFVKVAELVEAALGPINVKSASQPSAEQLRQAAIAKASAAAKSTRSAVPTSLSEFPAGQHAAQDEHEAIDALSPTQLAEKFAKMSPDAMDAYFANL